MAQLFKSNQDDVSKWGLKGLGKRLKEGEIFSGSIIYRELD